MNHEDTFLSFVDECTELNSNDAGRRRRAIHLFGQLLTDPQLPSNQETATLFFEFFSKRLDDFMITEEALNVMTAIDKTYHDAILVHFVILASLIVISKDIYHFYQYRYQSWNSQIFFTQTCL